ncbi:hypothetical protein [Leifsonia sp. EB34]|uniref:hypothetical protein n=1 Tax=Leifsonia sp. EB34 TaxID=3156303 RepID=UPI003515AFE1
MSAAQSGRNREMKHRRGIPVGVALLSVLTVTACVSSAASHNVSSPSSTTSPNSKSESIHTPEVSSAAPAPQDPSSDSSTNTAIADAKTKMTQACVITNAALANPDFSQRTTQEQWASDLGRDAAEQDPQWTTMASQLQTFHDLSAKEIANNGLPPTEKDTQIHTAYAIRDACIAAGTNVVIPD